MHCSQGTPPRAPGATHSLELSLSLTVPYPPAAGTLSSYCYVLMCIHLLQTRPVPVLPVLQQLPPTFRRTVGQWTCEFCDDVSRGGQGLYAWLVMEGEAQAHVACVSAPCLLFASATEPLCCCRAVCSS